MDKKMKEKIKELKKKYGKRWRKLFKLKKNYPFGKKSKPRYTLKNAKSGRIIT